MSAISSRTELISTSSSLDVVMATGGGIFCNSYTGLGDAIILGPILLNLSRRYPGRVFFSENPILDFYRSLDIDGFDTIQTFDRNLRRIYKEPIETLISFFERHNIVAMLNFRRDVIQYPKEYSKVANVLINHNYAVSDMCSLTSTQDQIEKHVIELVVEYIAKLGVSFELPEAGWLYRYSSVLRKTDFGRSSDVVVYLGSGQQHKRMPTSFWLEVVYTLANQYGFKVSVLPGYSEEEQQEALYFFDILNNANIKYSYPKASNLMDIAQILLSNQIVVSSDTYIIHLSGALNIPVVGIYTSTSEVMYGPYFKPSDTVCSEFYSSCEWKNKIGNCNAWEQHCEKTLCKSYIRVDDVVEKIIHLINNR